MTTLTAAERQAFTKSSASYADGRIRRADADNNGKLTRAEAKELGDLKDTYDLYAERGKTVQTDQFLGFYKAYVRVAMKGGGAPPADLADNVNNWVALRNRPAPNTDLGRVVTRVLDEYGLDKMGVEIDMTELKAQVDQLPNTVDFEKALREALDSFLKDGDDLESPYGLIAEDVAPQGASRAELEAMVKDFMNRPTSMLRLNARNDPPEGGEPVEESWVFSLYLEDLSDHGHWAIVDRAGNNPTYNYGFN